jgi:hypothetical protein
MMTANMVGRLMLIVVLASSGAVFCAKAQDAPDAKATVAATGEPASEAPGLPEFEFVAAPSFRSASLVQGLWRDLGVEGHYFGGDENNVGYTGGYWSSHGKDWKIAPGFGVAFGDNGFRTMPALCLRWGYEHNWFVSEGLYVQGLLHTSFFPEGTEPEGGHPETESVVPSNADGNHVSARWRRLTAGGTWEHMQFREGREWKGGIRVAYRVLPSLSFTFFAVGPGREVRGGILFQPEEKK